MQQLDEDGWQEYQLALLEGETDEDAMRRGRLASNALSYKRQLGPWSRSSLPVLRVAEFFDWAHLHSVTMDSRPQAEVEAEFDRREQAASLLDYCTSQQRAVIEARCGIATGAPMTYVQISEKLGYTHPAAAFNREAAGIARIHRELHRAETSDEIAEERRRKKNEYNRKLMARKRAEKKGLAA